MKNNRLLLVTFLVFISLLLAAFLFKPNRQQVKVNTKRPGSSIHTDVIKEFDSILKTKAKSTNDSLMNVLSLDSVMLKKAAQFVISEYDDVFGITWHKTKRFKHYSNSNHVSVYFGTHDSMKWLKLIMSYQGDDWIFFNKAYLSYDGNTLEIPFKTFEDHTSDNDHKGVWEWINVTINDSNVLFLLKLANSPNAKMRLSGKYSHTRTISKTERDAIREVLTAYLMNKV